MIQNRYKNELVEGNQLLLDLNPANYTLRIELAIEIQKALRDLPKVKILEIGSGEGNLTEYILKYNASAIIDCVDISQVMIERSKTRLEKHKSRIRFFTADALDHLKNADNKYSIIVSSWTIHNFPWEAKIQIFSEIYQALSQNAKLLLLDKIYPDNVIERHRLLDLQLNRYEYLHNKKLKHEIQAHEKEDYQEHFRMDEPNTINQLKEIGFRSIKIIDRVERDIILIASK